MLPSASSCLLSLPSSSTGRSRSPTRALSREEGGTAAGFVLNPRWITLRTSRAVPFRPTAEGGSKIRLVPTAPLFTTSASRVYVCFLKPQPLRKEILSSLLLLVMLPLLLTAAAPLSVPRVRVALGSPQPAPPPRHCSDRALGAAAALLPAWRCRARAPTCTSQTLVPQARLPPLPPKPSGRKRLRHPSAPTLAACTSQEAKPHPSSPWEVASQLSPLTRTP